MAIEALQPKWRHLDKQIDLIRSREIFSPLNEPPSEPMQVKAAAGHLFKLSTSSTLQLQASSFSKAWKAGRWQSVLHPAIVEGEVPAPVNCVAFWNREDITRDFPLLREIAMYHFSVALSTACAERFQLCI